MGPPSAKFDPEMEDKYGQNPIQTAKIFAAADAKDCAEADATSASHCSCRSAEEAYPVDACALWFDHQCARDQTQGGVHLGEDEGNRMNDKLPRTLRHA
jgi:hypothetical protein